MKPEQSQRSSPGTASGDSDLLLRMRAGDSSALDSLIDRYWTPLVAYAARLLGGWDVAEDAAQEAFVRLWERRLTWGMDGSVSALLYRITRNIALDECKRSDRRKARMSTGPLNERRVPTPIEHLQRTELEAAFDSALAALPERRREAFILARSHDLSYREIADVMGIAPQTVANQVSSAMAELRDRLSPFLRDTPLPASAEHLAQ